jgi:hypothetical protein
LAHWSRIQRDDDVHTERLRWRGYDVHRESVHAERHYCVHTETLLCTYREHTKCTFRGTSMHIQRDDYVHT